MNTKTAFFHTEGFNTKGRYPVGESFFESIRENGNVYVDKTNLIYQLTHDSKYYFLSRPRRFGKSLMLSTLRAYFEGRKYLFEGLEIADLEQEWRKYPVIHLSMGSKDFQSIAALEEHLKNQLKEHEQLLDIIEDGISPEIRFYNLIRNAYQKYGEQVVILMDEYDKPMLDTQYRDLRLHEDTKSLMRGFYGVIKDSAQFLRFVMITGVTKFSHLNLFSGLNNLNDISLDPEYNALCGISESEMHSYFSEDIKVFGERNGMSESQSWEKFKEYYDGYHFAGWGEDIYNPFSVLSAFSKMRFGNYWYRTGNSKHLLDTLAHEHRFNFEKIEGYRATEEVLMDTNISYHQPIALLYQAGYLTIKNFDSEDYIYTLGMPNREVAAGFYDNLMSAIAPKDDLSTQFNAALLIDACSKGDGEGLMNVLNAGLATFKYDQMKEPSHEIHFHYMLHIMCMCAGVRVESEVQTTNGRIDMVLKTRRNIFIVEFKVDKSVDDAINQILTKNYAAKYQHDKRKVIQIGANFSTETRLLTGWRVITD